MIQQTLVKPGIQTTDYKTCSNIALLNKLNNFFERFEALNNTPAQKTPPTQ